MKTELETQPEKIFVVYFFFHMETFIMADVLRADDKLLLLFLEFFNDLEFFNHVSAQGR